MTRQSNQLHDPIVYVEVGLVRHGIHPDTHCTTMHTGPIYHLAQRPNSQQAEPTYTTSYSQDHHVPKLTNAFADTMFTFMLSATCLATTTTYFLHSTPLLQLLMPQRSEHNTASATSFLLD